MTKLDRAVLRAALRDARRLVSTGHTVEQAASLATPAAWMEFRQLVLDVLLADMAPPARVPAEPAASPETHLDP